MAVVALYGIDTAAYWASAMWIGYRAEAVSCCLENGVYYPTRVSASLNLWVVRSDVQNHDLTRHDLPVVHSHFRKLHACDVRAREKMWLMLLLLYNQ